MSGGGGDPGDRPAASGGRCPVCGRPRVHRYRPFCSATCRDRDLIGWLEGRYAVPAVEIEDEDPGDVPPPSDRD